MMDDEFLMHAVRGDESAFEFCKMIVKIASTWDDLVDKDKPVSTEDINDVMQMALLYLPNNQFYRRNVDSLLPVMQQSAINWHIANKLAEQQGIAREIAHVMRYAAADILVYAAALKGGIGWARVVGPELRLRCQKENYQAFDKELRKQKQQGDKP